MSQNVPQESTTLSKKQLLAIPYLTASPTFAEAAENLGVSRKTVYRWLNETAFREEYERQREEAATLATTEIRALMLKAVVVMAQHLESDDPEIRARASRDVMTYGIKAGDAEKNRKVAERLHRFLSTVEEEQGDPDAIPPSPQTHNPNSLRL